jgi:predicted transcriptional regulator
VRQTQAIPQILSARYFRNGGLTLDDFIDAAVRTTYPSDQALARIIAEDIILGREKKKLKAPQRQTQKSKTVSTVKKDALAAVMEQIKREQDLAKKIDKDKVEAGFEYLQDLRKRKDTSLYDASMNYLNEGDVVLRGLTSDEELRQEASAELLDDMGSLSSQNIMDAKTLEVLDNVAESPNAAESLAARAYRGDKGIVEEFKELADRDPATAARALRHMEDMGAGTKTQRKDMDEALQDSLDNLSEVADYVRHLERLPDNIDEHLKNAPQQYQLGDAAEFSETVKEHTADKTDLMEDILEQYDKQYDQGASSNVDFRQLAENARNTEAWKSLLNKKTKETIEHADSRSSPSDYLKQKIRDLSRLVEKVNGHTPKESWEKAKQEMADAAVTRSPTKSHLRKTVRELSRQGIVPSEKEVREAGEKLGMTEEEILELLNPSYRVIKKLIEQGVKDFERLNNLISSAGLTDHQLRELADLSAQTGNQSALGAIAHENFGAAMGMGKRQQYGSRGYSGRTREAGPVDEDRAKMVFGGLLGGPAANIVKIWYAYRDQLPDHIKQRLKEIAKRLLIDLGKRYARATMGSSMLGGLQQSTTVRPFRIGDDIDLIDLEETIDSLLSQGRADFQVLNVEDFLICETYQGHRAFVWALDKSGSMHSPEKLGMLAISVMAGLYGTQKDDFGVCLFDNVMHIVKRVDQKQVSVEKVASDLLDVRASGGTGGRTSLQWALDNFDETRAKEKIFIFATDAYLSDQAECEKLAEKFKHQDIKMIILVPKSSYDLNAADKLAKKSHGIVLDIGAVEELPEKLLRLTNY